MRQIFNKVKFTQFVSLHQNDKKCYLCPLNLVIISIVTSYSSFHMRFYLFSWLSRSFFIFPVLLYAMICEIGESSWRATAADWGRMGLADWGRMGMTQCDCEDPVFLTLIQDLVDLTGKKEPRINESNLFRRWIQKITASLWESIFNNWRVLFPFVRFNPKNSLNSREKRIWDWVLNPC